MNSNVIYSNSRLTQAGAEPLYESNSGSRRAADFSAARRPEGRLKMR